MGWFCGNVEGGNVKDFRIDGYWDVLSCCQVASGRSEGIDDFSTTGSEEK